MTQPRYFGLQRDELPSFDGVTVIAGEWNGHRGPIESLTGITLMTISSSVTLTAPRDHNVFFYVVRGSVRVNGTEVRAFNLVDFENDGETIEVEADANALVLFGHAKPYGEPVVSYGPFVMNTKEEIVRAIRDYQAGEFS